jgi:hypothetical protein
MTNSVYIQWEHQKKGIKKKEEAIFYNFTGDFTMLKKNNNPLKK